MVYSHHDLWILVGPKHPFWYETGWGVLSGECPEADDITAMGRSIEDSDLGSDISSVRVPAWLFARHPIDQCEHHFPLFGLGKCCPKQLHVSWVEGAEQ